MLCACVRVYVRVCMCVSVCVCACVCVSGVVCTRAANANVVVEVISHHTRNVFIFVQPHAGECFIMNRIIFILPVNIIICLMGRTSGTKCFTVSSICIRPTSRTRRLSQHWHRHSVHTWFWECNANAQSWRHPSLTESFGPY